METEQTRTNLQIKAKGNDTPGINVLSGSGNKAKEQPYNSTTPWSFPLDLQMGYAAQHKVMIPRKLLSLTRRLHGRGFWCTKSYIPSSDKHRHTPGLKYQTASKYTRETGLMFWETCAWRGVEMSHARIREMGVKGEPKGGKCHIGDILKCTMMGIGLQNVWQNWIHHLTHNKLT